ncbi:type II toxin-antitoxin system RelB/DinJ family antitoxin [Scandinavium manionii]|uniref:type II toxin-antitoxin system RelB/DinJ family antitoxin n=1 Tax=Scandinavium manionii TaxID=2926520 RepID=UPI00216603FA|nr:type II toxin-antitoxin system RelB/DinJ family antitoxin [Scandinavium manionii]MCS2146801.1 type II toxin-antitoxin system RelB/DinJ family antitoxin [Scandinavium manionii]
MATETYVRARIDDDVKESATLVIESMGLTVSDAIRMFMAQVAEKNTMPFRVPAAAYRKASRTRAAINQLERNKGKRFNNVAALMDDLNNDEED